jgi:hypothetical protein|mmetsp:Transcript_23814/g.43019  ORF Transcript_23814/g.43019 Transcript_23814/m.43019 type:complete len:190 (-) Transcript_23814:347-916(-)|eukprot:CAMPEP_0198279788 /NCGR_PEP_ID=MMETSP1449-20131203/17_1 /TAXON_ID=420275 /ORGANISM="Attheya septentrionalis, Strain CCMP2084" /LENGTH=189 /DNA_ID=CAMNT_0043975005 /DNA_START=158 /DNA_END=727 /DNA_ORIENTATION=-
MSVSMLSPLAAPFQPQSAYFSTCEVSIFNEGIPSYVLVGEHADHDVLQGISDEAIDEHFPPSPEEIEELEAVQMFVECMARLSFLEEREESARENFSFVNKRWEARRAKGLVNRPYPPRADAEQKHGHVVNVNETNLVPYDHSFRAFGFSDLESKLRARDSRKRAVTRSKPNKGIHGHRVPIQQPRKFY